jgi:hypothetical protein
MIQRNAAAPAVPAPWLPRVTAHVSRIDLVRAEQRAMGDEACFMSQKRLLCGRTECAWRGECRRLVAAWKR